MFNSIILNFITDFARSALTGLGAYLIANGWATESQTTALTTGGIATVVIAWNWYEQVKQKRGNSIGGPGGKSAGIAGLILFAFAFGDMTPKAGAADFPVKAPVVKKVLYSPCTNVYCVGPYVGAGIAESGGSFNVISTGINGLASNNLNMFGEAGFDYWNGTTFLGINTLGEYGIQSNGVIPGGGNSALWGAGQWVKVGYNVASALGISAPSGDTPSLAGVAANSTPYINVGIFERPWGVGFLSGIGVQGWLTNNWTIHVDYNYVSYNNASINPIVKEQNEQMVLGGLDYHFHF